MKLEQWKQVKDCEVHYCVAQLHTISIITPVEKVQWLLIL